jgi:hypothetical protein
MAYPTHQQRIKLDMSGPQMLNALAQGNPGAMQHLIALYQAAPQAEPTDGMKGLGPWLNLDRLGIYGTDIYILVGDICRHNPTRAIAVLRAVGLGMFEPEVLVDACHRQDYSGRALVPVAKLYNQVRARLGNFDEANAAAFTDEELIGQE